MKQKGRKQRFASLIAIMLIIAFVLGACGGGGSSPAANQTPSSSSPSGQTGGSTQTPKETITIRLLEAGGLTGDSIEEGYIKPFTEKTGHQVIRESPSTLGKVEAMVKSGQINYDIVSLDGSATLYLADKLGLIEPLDWSRINPEPMTPEAKAAYGMGFQYVSNIMAWKKGTTPLNTWADFWDVDKYPGTRAMLDDPTVAIPAALLADGVDPKQLYPLDLDRAFASLERLAPHVSVWWTTGAQPIQLLNDGEVDYALVWSGRLYGNDDLEYTFNQGMMDIGYFAIPKGVSDKGEAHMDAIYAFLHEVSIPENQLKALEIVPYPGGSTKMPELLPKERMNEFPTSPENYPRQVLTDAEWWYINEKEVRSRWQEFKLSIGN